MSSKPSFIIYIPAAIALLVGVVHFYLLGAHQLSPWRLGGFGMFSEISDHLHRSLKAYTVSGEVITPIDLPEADENRIQTLPDEQALRRLLFDLSCQGDSYSDNATVALEFWTVRYERSSRELIPELRWKGQRAAETSC